MEASKNQWFCDITIRNIPWHRTSSVGWSWCEIGTANQHHSDYDRKPTRTSCGTFTVTPHSNDYSTLTQMITQHLLKHEEQPTGHQDECHGEVKHTRLLCHHDPPIAVELVPAWEDLPLSLHSPLLGVRGFHGWGVMMGADLIVLTFPALIQSKMHAAGLVYSSANAWFKRVESQNVGMQRRHVEKHRSWWTDVLRAKEMTRTLWWMDSVN